MSIHLQKFIERIRGHEARGVKEFVMPIAEAKGMAADLTELLLELNQLKTEKLAGSQEVVQIKLTGGGFK
jgi:hypothetical protein